MFAVINTTTVKQAQRKTADMFAPVAFINAHNDRRPTHMPCLEIATK